jgi:hypothetical protein
VWLTVIEAARHTNRVVLNTGNSHDFADDADPGMPCSLLSQDLEAEGVNPESVEIR